MSPQLHDTRICALGEGPLWHPKRAQLFWFDALEKRLLSQENGEPKQWTFDEHVSAAGWTGQDSLLIASETRLFDYNLITEVEHTVVELEADTPGNRSNDGRADTRGGFWIGTMGKSAEPNAGSIYRYYKGELRKLFSNITISNSICFAPDGTRAYFCDTMSGQIMRQDLNTDGWPEGDAQVHLDLRREKLNPDGSVTDTAGNLWNAQWGASRVAGYTPDGTFIESVPIPARHSSCPAFGGPDLSDLYCTTARKDLDPAIIQAEPLNGQTFVTATPHTGWPEPQVIL